MGASAREDWEDVGSKLTGLGLKLKMHFEQAAKEGRSVDEDKVKESLHKVGDAIEQTFAALGAASRDEAVIQDVKDAGRSTIDALDATFSELGERFRAAVKPAEGPVAADAEDSSTAAAAPDQPTGAEPPGTPDPGTAEPAPEGEPPAGPEATE
jgi:hypothetical protein